MITEKDLLQAIAECQGQRNPNANTCIKLASYYTILNQLKESEPQDTPEMLKYSFAPPPPEANIISGLGNSEFSLAVEGKTLEEIWPTLEEMMEITKVTNTRLYNGVIQRLKKTGGG